MGETSSKVTALENFDNNVAYSLNKNFLYIMANALEYEWSMRSSSQHSQSVRSLTAVVSLVFESDLKQFLPKVCHRDFECIHHSAFECIRIDCNDDLVFIYFILFYSTS